MRSSKAGERMRTIELPLLMNTIPMPNDAVTRESVSVLEFVKSGPAARDRTGHHSVDELGPASWRPCSSAALTTSTWARAATIPSY